MELLKGRSGRWGGWGRWGWWVVLAAAAVAASVAPGFTRAVTILAIPGRTNATPSIASDGDRLAVVWSASTPAGATDIFIATSRDGGTTFSPPVRVNDVDGDARVTGEQPPRVDLSGSTVTVVWISKGAHGTAIRFARSTDEGRSFTASAAVPGSEAAGNRGWEALSSSSVLWLDHRELADDASMPAMHHERSDAKPDGVAMAQKSKLMIATIDASVPPRAITGGVCYCCKTALVSAGNAVYAAWRHVYPGNLRDIAFTISRDGGRTFAAPTRVSEDKWELEGCPDDGPAMSVDVEGRIHIVWPTLVTGNGEPTIALFYSASRDGRVFTPRQRIATEGLPHHPQIAVGRDGAVALAWDELWSGGRRAVVARGSVDAGGPLRTTRQVVDDAGAAYYPVVAATRRGIVAAWTSGRASSSVIRVVTE